MSEYENMTKAELVAYAKRKYDIELDATSSTRNQLLEIVAEYARNTEESHGLTSGEMASEIDPGEAIEDEEQSEEEQSEEEQSEEEQPEKQDAKTKVRVERQAKRKGHYPRRVSKDIIQTGSTGLSTG